MMDAQGCIRRGATSEAAPEDRRFGEVAKAVGGGSCWLQMPLSMALAITETVAAHTTLRFLEWRGGGVPPPFQCIPVDAACRMADAQKLWKDWEDLRNAQLQLEDSKKGAHEARYVSLFLLDVHAHRSGRQGGGHPPSPLRCLASDA